MSSGKQRRQEAWVDNRTQQDYQYWRNATAADLEVYGEQLIQCNCFDRNAAELAMEETGSKGLDKTHFYRDVVFNR